MVAWCTVDGRCALPHPSPGDASPGLLDPTDVLWLLWRWPGVVLLTADRDAALKLDEECRVLTRGRLALSRKSARRLGAPTEVLLHVRAPDRLVVLLRADGLTRFLQSILEEGFAPAATNSAQR